MTAFSRFIFLLFAVFGFAHTLPAADPLQDIKETSGLGALDTQALKKGEIVSARGTKGSFARGTYIETCFFVHRPLAVVGEAIMQWDPSKYPDDEVAAYQVFRPPGTADFSRVARLKAGEDRWMLEQSAAVKNGKASELHLAPAEAAIFRQETGGASAAWERVLRARAEAVAAGGLGAAAAYPAGDVTIAAQTELRSLLGMTPGIAARFAGVTEVGPGSKSVFYAERSPTQGHTSFSLGTLTAQSSAESWQIMDCTYYASDTYFMSADLYYLWAWEGGTLVWQVDYASAPFRSYARGLDKVFAGREMIKETAKTIEVFRRNVEP